MTLKASECWASVDRYEAVNLARIAYDRWTILAACRDGQHLEFRLRNVTDAETVGQIQVVQSEPTILSSDVIGLGPYHPDGSTVTANLRGKAIELDLQYRSNDGATALLW